MIVCKKKIKKIKNAEKCKYWTYNEDDYLTSKHKKNPRWVDMSLKSIDQLWTALEHA